MEIEVQSGTDQRRQDVSEHPSEQATSDPALAQVAMDFDPDARQAEELRMLLVGFTTGLSIAGLFLVYLVLETAKLLP